jgi:hypothetical protein
MRRTRKTPPIPQTLALMIEAERHDPQFSVMTHPGPYKRPYRDAFIADEAAMPIDSCVGLLGRRRVASSEAAE